MQVVKQTPQRNFPGSEALSLDPEIIYLNTGTFGPPLKQVVEAEQQERAAMNTDFNRYFFAKFIDKGVPELVDAVGGLLGTPADNLAFTSGATESMSLVANGLDLKSGDEVLTTQHEHPAGIYPWRLRAQRDGICVTEVQIPVPLLNEQSVVDAFAAAITPNTRVISFCHVQYTDGAVLPVQALCAMARAKGIVSVVDGAQAVGMLDFSIEELNCDVYATSLHKWLGGPYGTGLLYVRTDVLPAIRPMIVEDHDGWDDRDRWQIRRDAGERTFLSHWPATMRKFSATFRYFGPLFFALLPVVSLYRQWGMPPVEARIKELAAIARDQLSTLKGIEFLSPTDPDLVSGIVTFRLPGVDTVALARTLSRQERVIVRAIRHLPAGIDAIRICTQIFNSPEQLARAAGAIERIRNSLNRS